MGNRTNSGEYPSVINPSDYPFLHIVKKGEEFTYVPSLSGATIKVGRTTTDTTPIEYEPQATLAIPLLPKPTEVPPKPINTETQVFETLYAREKDLLDSVEPSSNIAACEHGSYFGLLPEKVIAAMFRRNGFKVEDVFPKTGGRKRIQEHAVIFRRA